MSQTVIAYGDPKAARKWSGNLFLDITKKSYFDRKFVSTDDDSVIQRLTDLESDAGDTIHFDLSMQLRQRPVSGDKRLEGNEEALRFFGDDVTIDQLRHAVSAGGKMSRKRTVHDIRKIGKARLSEYWAKYLDEMLFIYLSGARGVALDFYEDTAYAGHAGNPIQAPDNDHILFAGDGSVTSKAALTSAQKMSRQTIERATVKAEMMRAQNPNIANIQPVQINGEAHYVCLMSPFQEHDLRVNDNAGWLEANKALAMAEGKKSPIFLGGLGMINNVVLHKHSNVIRFADYGAGANLPAARALFMGRQAGVVAYGSTGGLRFDWKEEVKDYGNEPTVASGVMLGVKKTRFNSSDYGVIAIDSYAKDPNAAA